MTLNETSGRFFFLSRLFNFFRPIQFHTHSRSAQRLHNFSVRFFDCQPRFNHIGQMVFQKLCSPLHWIIAERAIINWCDENYPHKINSISLHFGTYEFQHFVIGFEWEFVIIQKKEMFVWLDQNENWYINRQDNWLIYEYRITCSMLIIVRSPIYANLSATEWRRQIINKFA